jgi:hypothetical protein
MRVELEDLRVVVKAAKRRGRRVVLGGHSLGGSITTAYATWDFDGTPASAASRARLHRRRSGPTPVTPEEATASLQALQAGSPWLSFGGIPAPFAGLFNATGSTGALIDPDSPSIGQAWPLLPANLKPPVRVTNLAQYGYALDTETSPPALRAAQAHLGHLAASGDPRGWDQAGEITPIQRFAQMFSGTGLHGLDGTAWYHPQRLTIDSGAVAAGQRQPRAGDPRRPRDARSRPAEAPPHLRLRRRRSAARVLDAPGPLAAQSGIRSSNRHAHRPARDLRAQRSELREPNNDFVDALIPVPRADRRRQELALSGAGTRPAVGVPRPGECNGGSGGRTGVSAGPG